MSVRTQADLIEDLVHAHAHNNDRLRELSHEAASEIKRLNVLVRRMELDRDRPLWRRIIDGLADKLGVNGNA